MNKEENKLDKDQILAQTIIQIEKQFGKGSVMRLGDESPRIKIESIPTGSLELDIALGINGVPRGRVVEIFGPESAGKSTLALSIVAQAQKLGGTAAYIDAEHALDPVYSKRLGVDIEKLLISQPDSGEEALEITETFVRSGIIDVVVIDSVSALVPKAEIDGDFGDSHMGLQARLMSQALRKLTGIVSKTKTCIIFINQIRYKIGVLWGNPETTSGGNALKFYASTRLDIRKIEILKSGDEAIGNRVRVKVVKNKVAPPFKQAEFDLIFNSGISIEGEIIDIGVKYEIIKKSGTWYSYGKDDIRLGQGRENSKQFLKENSQVKEEILKAIKNKITIKIEEGKEPSSIEEAIIFLYNLRHEDGEIISSIETIQIPWDGKGYGLRQLIHHIEKNNLKDELNKRIKEKVEAK